MKSKIDMVIVLLCIIVIVLTIILNPISQTTPEPVGTSQTYLNGIPDNSYVHVEDGRLVATTPTVESCTPSQYDIKYNALLKQHEIWLEAQNRATEELNTYINMHSDYSSSLYMNQ